MKTVTEFQNKNILVLGIAKSGYAAATLLQKLGANVIVNDGKPLAENVLACRITSKRNGRCMRWSSFRIIREKYFSCSKNPGIPYSNPILVLCERKANSDCYGS